MKNNNIIFAKRQSLSLCLMLLLFSITVMILSSCSKEDDIPPPSAYEPPPIDTTGGCVFLIVTPELTDDASIDFECEGPVYTFFGEKDGSITITHVNNPVTSGINTSDKVVEVIQTAGVEPWAGFYFDLSEKIDFSVFQAVKVKVYSPAAGQVVNLKLEDSADGSISTETTSPTTVANEWEELTFDFSSGNSDKFDRFVLFFDFQGPKDMQTIHYFDDIKLGEGGTTGGNDDMPTTAAPTPTLPGSEVISIYSDAYTPITVTEFPTEWSGSGFEEIQIEGNNTIKYGNLDFTGIVTDYGNPTDLTAMSYVHFDYWTADGTELGFKLVNTAVDPAQEDLESVGTVIQNQWVSVDILLDDFAMDRSQVTQLLFDNLSAGSGITVFIDNLYFHNGQSDMPLVAAPTPTIDAADVIAIYSDAYTPITVTEFPTEWSGSGFEEIQIDGNNTIKYANLDFTGIVTDYGNPTDLTGMTHVHFDYWTADGTELGIKLVNTAVDPAQEDLESVGTVIQGQWVNVDILLDDFAFDRSQLTQILFDNLVPGDASITVYIDNLYFYKAPPTMPLVAAPAPTIDAANVISIYSDAYTPITVSELPTEWSGSGFEEIQIDGNNTIKYFNLDFTGIVTDYGNPTDLTGMTHVHFDYWTADGVGLGIKLVNTAVDPAQEDLESVGTVIQGQWVGVDILLDDFAFDRSQLTQILVDNLVPGDASITVYFDNLYFYK